MDLVNLAMIVIVRGRKTLGGRSKRERWCGDTLDGLLREDRAQAGRG